MTGAPQEFANAQAQARDDPGMIGPERDSSGIWEASDHTSPAAGVGWLEQPASNVGQLDDGMGLLTAEVGQPTGGACHQCW